jgi:hypothetical protein
VDPLRPAVFALVLATKRSNAVAFLAGWIVAFSLLFVIAFVVLGGSDMGGASEGQRTWASVFLLVIGGGLLVVAVRRWRRPTEGEPRPLVPDALLRRVDRLDPRRAAVIGALIQPRALTIAAALVVARDRSDAVSMLVGFALFGVASTSVLLGLLAYDIRYQASARKRLSDFVGVLEREGPRIITIGSGVAGAYLVVDALYGLLA